MAFCMRRTTHSSSRTTMRAPGARDENEDVVTTVVVEI
jgi:hypothetical protein